MKEVKDKKVYQCEYCGRLSLSKGGMKVHEICCKENPANRVACASCEYLKKVSYEVEGTDGQRCGHCTYYYNWGWQDKPTCQLEHTECKGKVIITDFICRMTGKRMYYPKRALMMRKDKKEDILSRCDCPMPQQCDKYSMDLNL